MEPGQERTFKYSKQARFCFGCAIKNDNGNHVNGNVDSGGEAYMLFYLSQSITGMALRCQ